MSGITVFKQVFCWKFANFGGVSVFLVHFPENINVCLAVITCMFSYFFLLLVAF